MTGVSGLTAKQVEIVKNGAVLTGDTIKVKDRLNRLSKDQVFYFPERMGGDNKWHVDVRLAEHIARYAGEGINYDVSQSKVSETSIRYDCTDERFHDLTVTYNINDDVDWRLIHATKKGTNEKDSSKSNNHLMCPEEGCGIKLTTVMGSKPRSLRRKDGEEECTKCGKFNVPTRSRPVSPPPEELKHMYSDGVIPRYVETIREQEEAYPEPPYSRPTPQPEASPSNPEPGPTEDTQPGPAIEALVEEPVSARPPVADRPSFSQKNEPQTQSGRHQSSQRAMAVAAFLLLALLLWWLL